MKIFVKAKPNSSKEEVKQIDELTLEVSVKEPPVKGQANRAVVKALAEYFGVPASEVLIKAGHTSKNKIVEIK